MNEATFIKGMALLSAVFDQAELPQGKLELREEAYRQVLADLSDQEFTYAVREALRERTFFPRPSELRLPVEMARHRAEREREREREREQRALEDARRRENEEQVRALRAEEEAKAKAAGLPWPPPSPPLMQAIPRALGGLAGEPGAHRRLRGPVTPDPEEFQRQREAALERLRQRQERPEAPTAGAAGTEAGEAPPAGAGAEAVTAPDREAVTALVVDLTERLAMHLGSDSTNAPASAQGVG